MEFHYYYIIQDIIGVFLVFINLRLAYVCLKIMKVRGISKKSLILLIHYLLYCIAGFNFLISDFGLRTWTVSSSIFFIGVLLKLVTSFKI
ncbi:hypothetical protein [Tepidibacter hydrothermalis]|uniref:Uncharacterized protein n=1 Tax=Tepidibacter hydrothermalis TaxID=3036126 RepID=A0ABY8EHP3_9FIRM|nr:hypothetical protein [Tepidibacter hydrothermalis]WFD11104.1 hypothetical protein P4S50_03240 [Tepidibacter hydrothermalis]